MSVRPQGTHTIAKNMADPDKWLEQDEKTVFSSWDEQLNELHSGNSNGTRSMRGRGVTYEEGFAQQSPFAENSQIKHEVEVSDNVSSDSIEHLLRDEDGGQDIKTSDSGEIYQVNMFETMEIGGVEFDGNNIRNTDLKTDLLGLHAIVYEDSDGEEYLLHWDPCMYDGETGDKMKFLDSGNSPDLSTALDTEENDNYFESYANHEREEGLNDVYETLIDGSEQLYRDATEEMESNSVQGMEDLNCDDNVYEKAWQGERWRAMADAVKNLNESMTRGYAQNTARPITF